MAARAIVLQQYGCTRGVWRARKKRKSCWRRQSCSRLFFRTLAELSLSFLTKIVSTARRNRRLSTKSVAGTAECDAFHIGKAKRRLHGRKTEHFKALTQIGHASAVADYSTSTGHNIKWDHFEILASGQCDLQSKIKETLLIRDSFFINSHRMQFLLFIVVQLVTNTSLQLLRSERAAT